MDVDKKINIRNVSSVLADARASLNNPTRPYTPFTTRKSFLPRKDLVKKIGRNFDDFPSQSSKQLPTTYSRQRHNTRSEDICYDPAKAIPDNGCNRKEDSNYQEILNDVNSVIKTLKDNNFEEQDFDDLMLRLSNLLKTSCITFLDNEFLEEAYIELIQILSHVAVETVEDPKKVIAISSSALQFLMFMGMSKQHFKVQKLLRDICNLLLSLSMKPENDILFHQKNIVLILLPLLIKGKSTKDYQLDPIVSISPLVYITGILHNLSNKPIIQEVLSTQGAISILGGLIDWLSGVPIGNENLSENALVEITGILRNLAINKNTHKQFWTCGIEEKLCRLIGLYSSHYELLLNISRVLSKLTLHETGRSNINKSPENIRFIVSLIDSKQFEYPLAIRLFFILGNLTASNDPNRQLIALEFNTIPTLIKVLIKYINIYLSDYEKVKEKEKERDHEKDQEKDQVRDQEKLLEENKYKEGYLIVDVLIKIIRLIANLAINTEAGPKIAASRGIHVILPFLEKSLEMKEEELFLNIISLIANLSFYCEELNKECWMVIESVTIVDSLLPGFLHNNEEVVIESCRAFGNFSRIYSVKQFLVTPRLLELFSILLDHTNREIVFTICGVLLNISNAKEPRFILIKSSDEISDKLVSIVKSAGLEDISMTTIACKALYNIFAAESEDDNHRRTLPKNANLMIKTLEEILDFIKDKNENEESYEIFIVIAKALCQYLNQYGD